MIEKSGDGEQGHTDPLATDALQSAERYYTAFLSGDTATVTRLMSDSWIQTDVNGRVQDKEAWLKDYYQRVVDAIKTGTAWKIFERQVETARRVGDVVVVLGKMHLEGQSSPLRTLRFTQVWVLEDSLWRFAVSHNAWQPADIKEPD